MVNNNIEDLLIGNTGDQDPVKKAVPQEPVVIPINGANQSEPRIEGGAPRVDEQGNPLTGETVKPVKKTFPDQEPVAQEPEGIPGFPSIKPIDPAKLAAMPDPLKEFSPNGFLEIVTNQTDYDSIVMGNGQVTGISQFISDKIYKDQETMNANGLSMIAEEQYGDLMVKLYDDVMAKLGNPLDKVTGSSRQHREYVQSYAGLEELENAMTVYNIATSYGGYANIPDDVFDKLPEIRGTGLRDPNVLGLNEEEYQSLGIPSKFGYNVFVGASEAGRRIAGVIGFEPDKRLDSGQAPIGEIAGFMTALVLPGIGATKVIQGAKWAATAPAWVPGVLGWAAADFAITEREDGNLSTLLTESFPDNPIATNFITEFLTFKDDDSEAMIKLKAAVEGGIIDRVFAGALWAAGKGIKKGRKPAAWMGKEGKAMFDSVVANLPETKLGKARTSVDTLVKEQVDILAELEINKTGLLDARLLEHENKILVAKGNVILAQIENLSKQSGSIGGRGRGKQFRASIDKYDLETVNAKIEGIEGAGRALDSKEELFLKLLRDRKAKLDSLEKAAALTPDELDASILDLHKTREDLTTNITETVGTTHTTAEGLSSKDLTDVITNLRKEKAVLRALKGADAPADKKALLTELDSKINLAIEDKKELVRLGDETRASGEAKKAELSDLEAEIRLTEDSSSILRERAELESFNSKSYIELTEELNKLEVLSRDKSGKLTKDARGRLARLKARREELKAERSTSGELIREREKILLADPNADVVALDRKIEVASSSSSTLRKGVSIDVQGGTGKTTIAGADDAVRELSERGTLPPAQAIFDDVVTELREAKAAYSVQKTAERGARLQAAYYNALKVVHKAAGTTTRKVKVIVSRVPTKVGGSKAESLEYSKRMRANKFLSPDQILHNKDIAKMLDESTFSLSHITATQNKVFNAAGGQSKFYKMSQEAKKALIDSIVVLPPGMLDEADRFYASVGGKEAFEKAAKLPSKEGIDLETFPLSPEAEEYFTKVNQSEDIWREAAEKSGVDGAVIEKVNNILEHRETLLNTIVKQNLTLNNLPVTNRTAKAFANVPSQAVTNMLASWTQLATALTGGVFTKPMLALEKWIGGHGPFLLFRNGEAQARIRDLRGRAKAQFKGKRPGSFSSVKNVLTGGARVPGEPVHVIDPDGTLTKMEYLDRWLGRALSTPSHLDAEQLARSETAQTAFSTPGYDVDLGFDPAGLSQVGTSIQAGENRVMREVFSAFTAITEGIPRKGLGAIDEAFKVSTYWNTFSDSLVEGILKADIKATLNNDQVLEIHDLIMRTLVESGKDARDLSLIVDDIFADGLIPSSSKDIMLGVLEQAHARGNQVARTVTLTQDVNKGLEDLVRSIQTTMVGKQAAPFVRSAVNGFNMGLDRLPVMNWLFAESRPRFLPGAVRLSQEEQDRLIGKTFLGTVALAVSTMGAHYGITKRVNNGSWDQTVIELPMTDPMVDVALQSIYDNNKASIDQAMFKNPELGDDPIAYLKANLPTEGPSYLLDYLRFSGVGLFVEAGLIVEELIFGLDPYKHEEGSLTANALIKAVKRLATMVVNDGILGTITDTTQTLNSPEWFLEKFFVQRSGIAASPLHGLFNSPGEAGSDDFAIARYEPMLAKMWDKSILSDIPGFGVGKLGKRRDGHGRVVIRDGRSSPLPFEGIPTNNNATNQLSKMLNVVGHRDNVDIIKSELEFLEMTLTPPTTTAVPDYHGIDLTQYKFDRTLAPQGDREVYDFLMGDTAHAYEGWHQMVGIAVAPRFKGAIVENQNYFKSAKYKSRKLNLIAIEEEYANAAPEDKGNLSTQVIEARELLRKEVSTNYSIGKRRASVRLRQFEKYFVKDGVTLAEARSKLKGAILQEAEGRRKLIAPNSLEQLGEQN